MKLKKQILVTLMLLFAAQSIPMLAMSRNIQGHLVGAVREEDYDQVVVLVKEGASKEDMRIALNWAVDRSINSAVDRSINSAIDKIIKFFVAQGVSVNGALGTAALRGDVPLCKFLIECGIDADISYRKNLGDHTPLMWPLAGRLSDAQKKLVIETLLTTISKKERERIEQQRDGVMIGLMAVKRGEPALPKDIRKIIARMVIAPFLEEHMAYAQKQLNDVVDLAQSEESPWGESSYALNQINPIIAPANWQRLREEVEANIRRLRWRII